MNLCGIALHLGAGGSAVGQHCLELWPVGGECRAEHLTKHRHAQCDEAGHGAVLGTQRLGRFPQALSEGFQHLGVEAVGTVAPLLEKRGEKSRCTVPESPVVVDGVDGGCQWLQQTEQQCLHQQGRIGPGVEEEIRVVSEGVHSPQQTIQVGQVVAQLPNPERDEMNQVWQQGTEARVACQVFQRCLHELFVTPEESNGHLLVVLHV
uniref:Uncharacterized protein n=1 Tax=Ixodes ricinus TaxID=34613 RepID=A0A6B0V1V2_IXORI